MGLLQRIKDAYNEGRNAAGLVDKFFPEELMQKKPWSKKDLIILISGIEGYLGQEEKRKNYKLLQKIVYDIAFKFSPI